MVASPERPACGWPTRRRAGIDLMEHRCSKRERRSVRPGLRVLLSLAMALAVTGCARGPMVLKHHLSGAEATLPELRGHVVLLNFWATWCRPCLREIPVLTQVAADHGSDVLFVAVYHEEEATHREAVAEWLTHQPEYVAKQVTWGSPALLDAFPHRFLPMTYVIARNGEITATFEGAIVGEREKELRAAVARALGVSSNEAERKSAP